MPDYTQIQIGDTAEIRHTITASDIEKFVALTGDDNKMHVDENFAGRTSFKKPVVHGMLGASFISTVIGTKLPGDGALWFSQSLEFLLPVRIGDEITVRAEVLRKIDAEQIIELQTDIINQHKQKVTTGKAKVKVIAQEKPSVAEETTVRKKVALIIGATGGIGQATCRMLAKQGFDVAVHYFSNEKRAFDLVVSVKNEGRAAHAFKADIFKPEDIHHLAEDVTRKLGTVTVLVNAATVKIPAIKWASVAWDDISQQWDINVRASFYLCKGIIPLMEKQKYGKIILLTTMYTESTPPTELMGYVTAKYALNGFAKALAVEMASKNITVNLVSPGMTDTELVADVPEKVKLLNAMKAPMKRLAQSKDVAGTIAYLASDAADYITGETIRVNGGQTML
ncbi:MAG TPA: SDR family oxidoreductase [bacterium]|nr:SDR family oxidoreductase [bacterium]HMW31767.1 SDR family oxidoreductase [bacterium]HMY34947.1 SDR family oxidoreductase [bacterium]HMZ02913.1 SDR family oxidoreductase [bacterium]HNB08048.1 SDR family oxidoreductase [bacterium]